jgi:hypothetical protein
MCISLHRSLVRRPERSAGTTITPTIPRDRTTASEAPQSKEIRMRRNYLTTMRTASFAVIPGEPGTHPHP